MKKFLIAWAFLGRLLAIFARETSVENSLAQANIYYQRPIRLGRPAELALKDIKQLNDIKDIKVIIHGYIGNRGHVSIIPVRNAYLSEGTDNVYMADWERAASYDYPTTRNLIAKVALRFALILSEFMTKHEIDPHEVHLIGHSLGAHIVGGVGRYFNGTLGRITGLDPALPLFTPQSPDGLRPSDGQFVDVIHTGYPVFGDQTPRGQADFYPNRGRTPQPGCHDADFRTFISCSHYRAVQLYAESIGLPKSFPAIPCSLADIRFNYVHVCRRTATLSSTVMMGEYLNTSAIGQYFFETAAAPPFGLGDNSEVYRNSHRVEDVSANSPVVQD